MAARAHAECRDLSKADTIERELIDAQMKAAKARAARAKAKVVDIAQARDDLRRLATDLEKCGHSERRYVTQDATTEKIGELLIQNPRGLLILRDELAGWLRSLDKPGREGDREFFLESANGAGSFTYDRVGRGTLHVPALCLSILGTTQPSKLRRLLVAAATGGPGDDDGLLQRFGVAVWPDVSSEYRDVDRWPDSEERRRAASVYDALAELTPKTLGATAGDEDDIPAVGLSLPALGLAREWRVELERGLRSHELEAWPGYEAHLGKHRGLVPAIALTLYAIDVVSGAASPGAVTLDAVRRAAAWGDFLAAHARRIYGVELDPGRAACPLLATRIMAGDIADGMAIRSIYRAQWAGLSDSQIVRAGLANLAGAGWVRMDEIETAGRTASVVRLHPLLRRLRDEDHEP